jgi:hypothetical protein
MSVQTISRVIPSVISLPGSAGGVLRCNGRELLQTELSGQAPAPAKTSVAPGSKKGLPANETSGPRSSISSASVALNESLANRLKTRCATVGSTVYTQTWKERVTSAGLRFWEHTARAPTTSGKGYTGWPTPNTPSGGPNATSTPNYTGGMDLEGAVTLVGWRTPNATDGTNGGPNARDSGGSPHLSGEAQLARWKTPHASDGEGGVMEMRPDCDGHYKLRDQAVLAGWATPRQSDPKCGASPASRDYKDTPGMSQTGTNPDGSERSRMDQLPRQASLAISGPTQSPTSAKTESGGVLNPAFSRWLQSYPEEWCQAAVLAFRSMPTKRRKRA